MPLNPINKSITRLTLSEALDYARTYLYDQHTDDPPFELWRLNPRLQAILTRACIRFQRTSGHITKSFVIAIVEAWIAAYDAKFCEPLLKVNHSNEIASVEAHSRLLPRNQPSKQ